MTSLCLSHQDASTDMQHGLFWSLRDLDLRSNLDLEFSRSSHVSFESSLWKKHDAAIADSLSLLDQKLFVKEYLARNSYFDNMLPMEAKRLTWGHFWCRPYQKKSLKAIDWYHLRSSSYHSSWHNGTFSEKYNNIYQTLTFDDLWWPQYCSEGKNDRNSFKRTYWELSNAFYRVFLTLLVFELEGGGNICLPPLGRSWLRPPLGRGLIQYELARWLRSLARNKVERILSYWMTTKKKHPV